MCRFIRETVDEIWVHTAYYFSLLRGLEYRCGFVSRAKSVVNLLHLVQEEQFTGSWNKSTDLEKHYTTDLSGLGLNQDYNAIVACLKNRGGCPRNGLLVQRDWSNAVPEWGLRHMKTLVTRLQILLTWPVLVVPRERSVRPMKRIKHTRYLRCHSQTLCSSVR